MHRPFGHCNLASNNVQAPLTQFSRVVGFRSGSASRRPLPCTLLQHFKSKWVGVLRRWVFNLWRQLFLFWTTGNTIIFVEQGLGPLPHRHAQETQFNSTPEGVMSEFAWNNSAQFISKHYQRTALIFASFVSGIPVNSNTVTWRRAVLVM